MRRGYVTIALLLGACGLFQQKKSAATAPGTKKSTGSVVYQDGPGGEKRPGSAPSAAEAAPPPQAAKPVPRPPSQDLPPEKRRQLVSEHLRRGGQAIQGRDADAAIRSARAALDLDESNVEAMILLAHGYYLKEYDDKVEAVLNIAQKQTAGQSHPMLWMLLGLVFDRTNREDQALSAYEKATQLKPDYVAALTNKGAIYLRRKRYADAVQVFEQVTQIQPQSASAHTNLGAAYRGRSADMNDRPAQREQLLRQAEMELKTALARSPNHAAAYFNLGLLYLDADPFPGLDTLPRLQEAMKYLREYKRVARVGGTPVVDEHLAAAQKTFEREQKLLERKKKRESEQKKGGQ